MRGRQISTVTILSAATATGAGSTHEPWGEERVIQAHGTTSAGAGAASINIEGSQTGSHWKTIGNIALTLGTTSTNDGFATDAAWRYLRANVASISGTDATVTVILGC